MFSFRFSPECLDSGQPLSHTGNRTPISALKGPYPNRWTMWDLSLFKCGLEPQTFGLLDRRSNQLSYKNRQKKKLL
jgi:hypothetical protein